jgi:hypothetical protein
MDRIHKSLFAFGGAQPFSSEKEALPSPSRRPGEGRQEA